jgi:predicted NBD/HSP70 family sugar kinase
MNDAKSAALAEAKWGALSDCKDGVAIVLGTAIGGAIIKDSQVHMGAHYSAGEFSFVSLGGELDDASSMWYGHNGNFRLIRMAARAKNMPEDQVSGEDVFRWVEEGDPKVCKVLDRFTAVIARMIFNLQMIYDPERFVIGGGISRQDALIHAIRAALERVYADGPAAVYHAPFIPPEVVRCRYGSEANQVGAYLYFADACGK